MKKYDSEYQMRKNYESMISDLQQKINASHERGHKSDILGQIDRKDTIDNNCDEKIVQRQDILDSPAETNDYTPVNEQAKSLAVSELKDSYEETEKMR